MRISNQFLFFVCRSRVIRFWISKNLGSKNSAHSTWLSTRNILYPRRNLRTVEPILFLSWNFMPKTTLFYVEKSKMKTMYSKWLWCISFYFCLLKSCFSYIKMYLDLAHPCSIYEIFRLVFDQTKTFTFFQSTSSLLMWKTNQLFFPRRQLREKTWPCPLLDQLFHPGLFCPKENFYSP